MIDSLYLPWMLEKRVKACHTRARVVVMTHLPRWGIEWRGYGSPAPVRDRQSHFLGVTWTQVLNLFLHWPRLLQLLPSGAFCCWASLLCFLHYIEQNDYFNRYYVCPCIWLFLSIIYNYIFIYIWSWLTYWVKIQLIMWYIFFDCWLWKHSKINHF